MNLNMSNFKKPFYYLFPIVGLNIVPDNTYNDFLFDNSTLLNKTEFIENFLPKDNPCKVNYENEVGIIHPDEIDFTNTNNTGKKYISSINNSFLLTKFFKYDDKKEKILINRATAIGSLIAFAFLIESNFETIISLSKDVYFTGYSRTKAIDSQCLNIIERTQMIPEAIHFSLPEKPFEFTRTEVKSILQTRYVNPIYNVIFGKNNLNGCKKRLVEALKFYISSLNSPNLNLQFLGSMISVELMLRNGTKDNYENIKKRAEKLVPEKYNIDYYMKCRFQSRHDFVHKGIFPRKNIVIDSIYYASIALIEFANLVHNANIENILDYLSNAKNIQHIFNGWEKHKLLS